MKIFDHQDALITMSYYSHGKMRAENIGKMLLEPEIMIMVNGEDIRWIAATFGKRCTIVSKSVAVCCSYPCTTRME